MKRLAVYAGLVLSLLSHQALAAKVYLMVFFDDAPLKGATVQLDDRNVGATDSRGAVSAFLEPGSHVLTLVDDNINFPIEFRSESDQDVEINVTFTATSGDEPQVNIRKFGLDTPAGEGFITGKILRASGAPVEGATVATADAEYSSSTDEFGVYVLKIPRGEYEINVSAPGFNTASVSGVRVMADLGVNATVTLRPEGIDIAAPVIGTGGQVLEEVFVLGVFNPQENAASVERYATSITNAIDAAQLERFGDSDVGSALNRVVGVSVIDRKYATVRGLDGRYISSSLNGLLMPSTDTQRREVELDLFPTVIVGGIEIQKSFTADQLATTTGGAIMIETKGIPDERVLEVSGSLGYNPGATGADILSYASSEGDWAGFDSGLRELPNGVLGASDGGRSLTVCDFDPVRCTSPAEAAQLGVQFQDDYKVGDKTGLPNGEVSVAYGDRLPAGDNEWGYYLAADFDRSTEDRGNAEWSNPLRLIGNYQRSQETTAITTYAALGYEYGAANEILSKTMYLHNTDDITRVDSGIDTQEDNQTDIYLLDWIERQFTSQAFTGYNEFEFDHGVHELDWRVSYSETERDEPDRRTYTYFNNIFSTSAFERRWSKLDENSTDLGADYSINLEWGNISSTEIQFGGMYSDKERNFDQYRFGVALTEFGQETIDLNINQSLENEVLTYNNFAVEKVRLRANTTDTDSYDSQEEIQAGYVNTNTDFGEDWTLVVGARFEKFNQKIAYPNDANASNELDYDDWYPAVNLAWRPTEEIQVRLGYSQTVSYPGIIERAEAQTFDPETDDPIFGNPELTVSTIDNSDIRLEYYFSESESVSLAYFYKSISDPVERAIPDASGSAAAGTTFVNQESADLSGVEIDGTKNVMETDDYLVFLSGNISYIDSKVDLSADSLRLEGANADGRQLQGQSEWLGNLQIGMDHYPTEQKFTLLINYFDKRIFRVSRGINNGPEYEDGRLIVDFTYEKIWNDHLVLDGSIKNILNTKVEYSQNDDTIESFNVGRFFKVGMTYKF